MRFQICPAFHIATLQSHWLYFHLPTPNKANPVSYISQTSALDQSEISKILLYNISQTHFCIVKMVRLIKFYHSEQQSLSSQLKKIQIASRPDQSKYRKGPIYQNCFNFLGNFCPDTLWTLHSQQKCKSEVFWSVYLSYWPISEFIEISHLLGFHFGFLKTLDFSSF